MYARSLGRSSGSGCSTAPSPCPRTAPDSGTERASVATAFHHPAVHVQQHLPNKLSPAVVGLRGRAEVVMDYRVASILRDRTIFRPMLIKAREYITIVNINFIIYTDVEIYLAKLMLLLHIFG